MKIKQLHELKSVMKKGLKKLRPDIPRIAVGMDTCGIGNGGDTLFNTLRARLKKNEVGVTKTGCFGYCAKEPLVNVYVPGSPLVIFKEVTVKDLPGIISYAKGGKLPEDKVLCKIEDWDHLTGEIHYGAGLSSVPEWYDVPFFKHQKKIVLRNSGLINPDDIEEYIAVGGYFPLFKALNKMSKQEIIDEVRQSKLRGRGGAGYPTGVKWKLMEKNPSADKYIICNADEGDPGAYMNRNEIESDPHMLLEGMIIGAFAMGASQGLVYMRAEYPLAVQRMRRAIEQARQLGILGNDIFGSGFDLDIEVIEGAGAFVCGEETALIASAEGKAGRPVPRPPYPAEKGLRGKPTNINNVETWCNIPVIIKKGAEWFRQTGTQASSGTKVFSLVGKIENTGLVELPLGETLQTLVYNIGGGTGTRKKIKALQTGGPSGGCIPARLFKTQIDYETLGALGAIMGSGGMVVMDDDNCMVDVARYFVEFNNSESCGKCTPCREGLYQELLMLKGICSGDPDTNVTDKLVSLGGVIKDSALCGLGQTGPNPVLTTLKYFPEEYAEHIDDKRCGSGVCQSLFVSPCENTCPLHMNIPGFLQMLKEGNLEGSFESIVRENPLPSTIGRICHFQCRTRCRREDIDKPVEPGEVHRYIADEVYENKLEVEIYEKILSQKQKPTGKTVSIIGAGPAGLMAGYYLSRLGHSVTIYEAAAEAGGVLRFGIPQYRLPKSVLKKEIDFIRQCGVKMQFNTKVDAAKLKELKEASDAVFIATGAYKNSSLDIPGEKLEGVMSGTSFLEKIALGGKVPIGRHVAVIGAGNVAIDAARSALRMGSEVTIVYRREKEDMPANKTEIEEAENEGIKFIFLAAPKEIVGDRKGLVTALLAEQMIPGEFDMSGRRRPVGTGNVIDVPCDCIMTAIGEKVDGEFLKEAGVSLESRGTVKADRSTLRTGVEKIWAGGDVVSGPATAVEAMAYGTRAAKDIDRQLTEEDRFGTLFETFNYENKVPDVPAKGTTSGKRLSVKLRERNFKEVSLGLTKKQALLEADRCLRCDVKQ